MLNVDDARVYTDFNGLAKLKQGAREKSPEAVKEVAKQFESLFLNMVMKSMRQAKLADGMLDNQQTEFYQDMYDQQMALQLAGKPGVGLANVIAKQLAPDSKPKDGDKMQLGDYLSRAVGAHAQASMPLSAIATAKVGKQVQPLDESGLNRLQQSLELLEQAQQANEPRWQALENDWTERVGDNAQASASKLSFVNELLPQARQAAKELGVDANVLLAQAALETGWGQSVIKNPQGDSSFNLFNIKADRSWQGKQARVATVEFNGDVAQKTTAGFRVYGSYQDSFDDYVNFIKSNPRYSEALKQVGNPANYIRELQAAGYATDPRYAEKVMSIYRSQTAGQAANNAG